MKKRITVILLAALLAGCSSESASVSELSSDTEVPESTPSASSTPSDTSSPRADAVTIAFDTVRMPAEASNQYAVWVEDSSGNLVKTLYVSSFTGQRKGYTRRPDSLCHWVEKARPQNLSDEQIDAFSGATFEEGNHELSWDFTDQSGARVPDGEYDLYLEGTLYWSSNVLYEAVVNTSGKPQDISINEIRSDPENHTNETMVQNVTFRYTE